MREGAITAAGPEVATRLRTADGALADGGILPLEADHLAYEVAGRPLVEVERLALRAGGPTAILGPNGAGKSLLLRLLHGLIAPTRGAIRWNGAAADGRTRRRQAMVFQKPVLLRRSVAANLDYALKAHGVPAGERRARVAAALEQAALTRFAWQPARTLSGGEKQRLALVRALAVRPEILFLDEPTSSLDPGAVQAIEALIQDAAARGTKVVLVTHDLGQARRLAREIVFMNRGRVVERTPAAAFFARPRSEAARAYVAGRLVL